MRQIINTLLDHLEDQEVVKKQENQDLHKLMLAIEPMQRLAQITSELHSRMVLFQ